MQTEVANTNKNSSLMVAPEGAWGTEDLLSSDVKFPRLLLMQANSPQVSDSNINAQPGDIRGTLDYSLCSSKNEATKVVVFYTKPFFKVSELPPGSTEYKFREMWPRRNNEWQDRKQKDEKGMDIKVEACVIMYCVLYNDLITNQIVPYEVMLINYSLKHAMNSYQQVVDFRLKPFNKNTASLAFNLGVKVEENSEKKKFFCFKMEMAKDESGKIIETTAEQQGILAQLNLSVRNAYASKSVVYSADLDKDSEETVSSAAPREQF